MIEGGGLTTERGPVGMRIKKFVCVGMFLIFWGCSNSEITAAAGKLTQSDVDTIITNCDAPSSMLTLSDNKITILIKEKSEENLAAFGCIFDALDATGETNLRGVGNQRSDTSTDNKASASS